MKKENKILIITFFILISLFLISSPGFLNITGKFLINIKAVYEKASISISVVDNIPPNITTIASSVTSSSATITWNTNELANSTVYYGITTATTSTLGLASLTTSHSITLSSLSSSTLYYYNVSSCDNAGNCNTSSQYNFTTSAAGGGGGGGGTGAVVKEKIPDFTVDKDLIKVVLKQGETQKEFLEIENTGETELDITIDLENLRDFVIFSGGVSEYSFKLKVGEKQIVQLIFDISKDQKPGIYPGKLIIKGDGLQTVVTTIIEIESEKPLFDIEVNILEEFKEVIAGEGLLAEITLYNPKGIRLADVDVEYIVKDIDGTIIINEHEAVAVETRTSFIKRFTIPSSLKPGSYIFYAKVTYNGVVGSSSSLFEVVEKPHVETPAQTEKYYYVVYIIIAIITFFGISMSYQHKKLKEITESIKKVRAEDLIKAKKIKYKGGE